MGEQGDEGGDASAFAHQLTDLAYVVTLVDEQS